MKRDPKDKESKNNLELALLLLEEKHASQNGLIYIKDTSGTNINVQVIDTSKIDYDSIPFDVVNSKGKEPVNTNFKLKTSIIYMEG